MNSELIQISQIWLYFGGVQQGFNTFPHTFLQFSVMLNILIPCSGQLKHPLTQQPPILKYELEFVFNHEGEIFVQWPISFVYVYSNASE